MKFLITLALAAAAVLVTSCGLNEEEKLSIMQMQQAKDDSIRVAEINYVKKTDALKTVLRDSLTFYTALLGREQNSLILNKTALYTANDEMTQIQGFHLGRLPQVRDQQVRGQELKIQSLVSQQANLQSAIQYESDKISLVKSKLTELK
jgi:hypothetical protein